MNVSCNYSNFVVALSEFSNQVSANLATTTKIRQFFAFIYIYFKMSYNIQLHKNDLPDELKLGNTIAVDGEFMGLNVRRDPLCLIQLSSGNSDAHIVQFNRNNCTPNLIKVLSDEKSAKFFHFGKEYGSYKILFKNGNKQYSRY